MEAYLELLKLILPEVLVDHFALVKHEKHLEVLHLYFEEKNTPPKEHSDLQLTSKGFHKQATLQDFPLRGNKVYLHVRRRRWIDKSTDELVERDWNMVAQGTRMTKEFASFLKEISRYQS